MPQIARVHLSGISQQAHCQTRFPYFIPHIMAHNDQNSEVIFDIIGLGFGPANLAIAGAILEKRDALASTQVCTLRMPIRSRLLMLQCLGWSDEGPGKRPLY